MSEARKPVCYGKEWNEEDSYCRSYCSYNKECRTLCGDPDAEYACFGEDYTTGDSICGNCLLKEECKSRVEKRAFEASSSLSSQQEDRVKEKGSQISSLFYMPPPKKPEEREEKEEKPKGTFFTNSEGTRIYVGTAPPPAPPTPPKPQPQPQTVQPSQWSQSGESFYIKRPNLPLPPGEEYLPPGKEHSAVTRLTAIMIAEGTAAAGTAIGQAIARFFSDISAWHPWAYRRKYGNHEDEK